MSSIWKDLLFLHGHLVRKDDLSWRADTRTGTGQDKSVAGKNIHPLVLKCCAAIWPRLARPR